VPNKGKIIAVGTLTGFCATPLVLSYCISPMNYREDPNNMPMPKIINYDNYKQDNWIDYFEEGCDLYTKYSDWFTWFTRIPQKYRTEEMYLKLIGEYRWFFPTINHDNLSQNICDYAFKTNVNNIVNIPPKYITKDICNTIVEHNRFEYFKHIPHYYFTKNVCDSLVEKNPMSLKFIPEASITQSMCSRAFSKNSYYFQLIPEKYRNEYMCERVIDRQEFYNFKYIPQYQFTNSLCFKMIRTNPMYLQQIPEKCITQEMCDYVMQKDINFIEIVPKQFRNMEMSKNMLAKGGPYYFSYMTESLSPEMYEKLTKLNPMYLHYMNKNVQRLKIYIDAIEKNISLTKYIPNNFENNYTTVINDTIVEQVKNDPSKIEQVSSWNSDLCRRLFEIDNSYIKYFPKHYQTIKMCSSAILKDPKNIKHIKINYNYKINNVITQTVIHTDKNAFYYVPKQYLTADLLQRRNEKKKNE
jgi:hypothetical protein